MAIIGWFYQHTNGSLIYKRELGGTAADIRESTFAVMLWPLDPEDRECAWRIIVEASALHADRARVEQLAKEWGCDDLDAQAYASRIGVRLYKDGKDWCATRHDFINLQESPAGFGSTGLAALTDLCKALGYRAQKTWGASFADLVKAPMKKAAAQ